MSNTPLSPFRRSPYEGSNISYKDFEGMHDEFDPVGPVDPCHHAIPSHDGNVSDIMRIFSQLKNSLPSDHSESKPTPSPSTGQRVTNVSSSSSHLSTSIGHSGDSVVGSLRSKRLPPGSMSLEELEAELLGKTTPVAQLKQTTTSVNEVSSLSQPPSPVNLPFPDLPPYNGPLPSTLPGVLPPHLDFPSALRLGLIPNPAIHLVNFPHNTMMHPTGMASGMVPPIGLTPNHMAELRPPMIHPEESSNGKNPSSMPPLPDTMIAPSSMSPPFTFPNIPPEDASRMTVESQDLQLRTIKRLRREARIRETARFNGIMSQREKDLIARIQISQLVTSNPLADDYYFQVYNKPHTSSSSSSTPKSPTEVVVESSQNGNRNTKSDRVSQNYNQGGERRMHPRLLRHAIRDGSLQEQIDHIVEHAKKKNKTTEFSLEGALGKVSLKTTKNPRQQLHLAVMSSNNGDSSALNPIPNIPISAMLPGSFKGKVARRLAFKVTEELFELVLSCETLHMSRPTPESKRTVVITEDGDERVLGIEEETEIWEQELSTATNKLWLRLLEVDNDVHSVIQLLSVNKGKKLWSRLIQLLSPTHQTKLILDLFTRINQLDVIRQASIPALYATPLLFPGLSSSRPTTETLLQFVGEVEEFMQHLLPSLVQFMAEATWPVVTSSLEGVLNCNDVVRLGSSKVGLALLTLLVSRSEILNQMGQAPGWSQLYLRLFNELQGHYLGFFPISAMTNLPNSLSLEQLPPALVPPVPLPVGSTASDLLDFYLTDDAHVWQFLASLAVAATVEQQTMLVTEVRERILSNVAAGGHMSDPSDDQSVITADKSERALYNVNLFLHALGLDASQIQTAM